MGGHGLPKVSQVDGNLFPTPVSSCERLACQALYPSCFEPQLRACWTSPSSPRSPHEPPPPQIASLTPSSRTHIYSQTDKGTGTDLCSLGPQGLAVPEVMVSSVYKEGSRQEAPQSPSFWSVSCASFSKRSCLGKYQMSSS